MDSFVKVPKLWKYERHGKSGAKIYPLTITLNVKNPQYRAINCPNEFKRLLNDFLNYKQYKYHLNGVLEYHKPTGALRNGGLHLHGFAYCRNPPRDNKNNLFHFHLSQPDEIKGIKGYILYSQKAISETEKRFKELASIPITPKCLFDD